MSIFQNEDEMQLWIEEVMEDSEGLGESIVDFELIIDYIPRNYFEKKIKESYQHCYPSLMLTELLTKNENISSSKGDVLKPDIIAYATERESIVLIELKNISGPSRQAGTELSAYSGELKGYLSHLSDGDIINVIVSPIWPTLLKHYIFNNIVWQNKNMICLEPCIVNGVIKLKPLEISTLIQAETPLQFSSDHLSGYHICLYDNSQYARQNVRKPTKLHSQIEVIKSTLSRMASEGEKENGHGFLILTKENKIGGYGLAPYMITLVNVAPFSSIERYFHDENIKTYEDLPMIGQKFYGIYTYFQPNGMGTSTSKIFNSGKRYLKEICRPTIESINTWRTLKLEIHSKRNEAIYFESWGIFKEKTTEMLFEKYSNNEYDYTLNSISLGFEVIEQLIDENYEFIHLPPVKP